MPFRASFHLLPDLLWFIENQVREKMREITFGRHLLIVLSRREHRKAKKCSTGEKISSRLHERQEQATSGKTSKELVRFVPEPLVTCNVGNLGKRPAYFSEAWHLLTVLYDFWRSTNWLVH